MSLQSKDMDVAVIGAGIGGLAISIRMARKGYNVTVYEKNSHPGGKISQLQSEGFRFDTGPSLFTLPELVDELFQLCEEDPVTGLSYEQLMINCKYFFADGSDFSFYQDKDLLRNEIKEKFGEEEVRHIFKRLADSREVYELSAPVFIFSSFFNKWADFNTPAYKNVARKLYKLDFLRTMHKANKSLFKDSRLVQLFDRYATYNGSNPWKAPATLNMIAHLENNIGAFFPSKGMYQIVESLYELAKKQGVDFRFDTYVKQINTFDDVAIGLETEEGYEPYDMIISDADTKYLSNELLPEHPLRKRLSSAVSSSSALIFYWGINRTFPELELHNILFSENYKKEFRHLFVNKTICDDPSVYLFISSKLVKNDAPEGHENWFVMINAPADNGQDWVELIKTARQNIIQKINHRLHTDIEKYIVSENIASPLTIESNTLSADGALYGTASNSMFSAFLRHPNHLRSIRNLFFVGGSVHPGGGIPLCLASAGIVDKQISEIYG